MIVHKPIQQSSFNSLTISDISFSYKFGYFDKPMQAPLAHNSSVKLRFGDSVHKNSHSLNATITLDFFSNEQKQVRKRLNGNIKTELEETSLVFELDISSGNTTELAEKLNGSEVVRAVNENSNSKVVYYGLENRLIIAVSGPELKSFFEAQSALFEELKDSDLSKQPHGIELIISSNNTLSRISELIKTKNSFSYGFLESLEADFEFAKTSTNTKILTIILERMIGFPGAAQLLQAFKQVNVQLNCTSTKALNEFPKVTLRTLSTKPSNEVVSYLSSAKIEKANIYLLNEVIYAKADFSIEGFSDLLAVLFD